MAYEINFCETKEQLKHLGEVVTGKADGSPTGADIDTSTLAYAGLVRDTLPELLSKLGWYSVGEWSTDPLISNDNQYVLYNGIRYVPLSIPYQVNSTANPDPEVLVGTELKVITDVTDEDITEAQNDIVGGSIFKGSNGEVVEVGDVVGPEITRLRVLVGGEPRIVSMSPIATGAVSLLTETGATIGGTSVLFGEYRLVSFDDISEMLSSFTFVGSVYSVLGTLWEKTSTTDPEIIDNFTPINKVELGAFDNFYDFSGEGISQLPPKTIEITSPITLNTEGFEGVGTPSLLYANSDMSGQAALSMVRASGNDLRLRDFRISGGPEFKGEALLKIDYQRTSMEGVRAAVETGSNVSKAIIDLENTISATLKDVATFNGSVQSVPGLYFGANTNAVDVLGGAYNALGHAIVVGPDAGERICLKTTIESTVASPYEGLLIQGGSNLEVDCYFENSGVTIEGGEQIKLGGTFGTTSSATKITGGESITVDNYRNRGASPRNGFEVDGGDVHFTQNNSISDNKTFITATVKVSGEYCSENLLQNPYFDNWTGGLPDNYDLVPSAGTSIVEDNSGLYGLKRLKWDVPIAGNLSLVVRMDSEIANSSLLGHDVTLGAWVYLPDVASKYYSFQLITDDGASSAIKEARFAAVRGAYVFVQLTASVGASATQLRFVVRTPVATGGEYAAVDAIKLIKGKTKSGIPFAI